MPRNKTPGPMFDIEDTEDFHAINPRTSGGEMAKVRRGRNIAFTNPVAGTPAPNAHEEASGNWLSRHKGQIFGTVVGGLLLALVLFVVKELTGLDLK